MRNYMAAAAGAWQAFKFLLANPSDTVVNDVYSQRLAQYRLGWSAYSNEAFSKLVGWESYASGNALYARTRGIYNPVTRLVDFYASHIYQGVLSEDGANLPDGEQIAIPLSRDTKPELKSAIAQTWQWGNWQSAMGRWVIYCAATGDGPVEILDDVERGKVYPAVVWPGHISDVEFDSAGNVVAYTKEYTYYDREEERTFTYKMEVDKEVIREYRDNSLFSKDENVSPERPNPYGFVPMVWNRHRDDKDGVPGSPAIRSWSKVERLNSLASRIETYITIQSKSPQILFSDQDATALTVDGSKTGEDDLKILRIKGAGSVSQLGGNLSLADARELLVSYITEIEHDHPEVIMYDKLRQMSQVTGPAANILLGDVRGLVTRARAGYDAQSIKLFQMMVAIGGDRLKLKEGGWKQQTPQQKKFAGFDLDSYQKGDLDFSIDPRPLVPETSNERSNAKMLRFQAIKAGLDASIPLVYQLQQDGVDEKDIKAIQEMNLQTDFGEGFKSADDEEETVEEELPVIPANA